MSSNDTINSSKDLEGKTKIELLRLIDTREVWNKNYVKAGINGLVGLNRSKDILNIKSGDIFNHKGLKHPCLIIKVTKTECIHLLLTSEVTCDGILIKLRTRFTDYQELYVTSTLGFLNNARILDQYILSIDQKQVLEVKKLLKLKYKGLFK